MNMVQNGFDTFIEVAHGKVPSGQVKRIAWDVRVLKVEGLKIMAETLAAFGV